jgi:hypothetical protein
MDVKLEFDKELPDGTSVVGVTVSVAFGIPLPTLDLLRGIRDSNPDLFKEVANEIVTPPTSSSGLILPSG